MVVDLSVRRQTYVEDCEVCCKPIEISFTVEGDEVDNFHARVVQHECDHLDGILYPMRMRDLRLLGYTDVLFPDVEVVDE